MLARARSLPTRQTLKMPTCTYASIVQFSDGAASSAAARTPALSTSSCNAANETNPSWLTAPSSPASRPPPSRRREAHQPRTAHGSKDVGRREQYYVLTILTDDKHHADMSALRRRWFPEKLLKVDAHVTLFHALPGSRLDELRGDIRHAVSRMGSFELKVGPQGVFCMGKGVGIEMDRASLARLRDLREKLRSRWNGEGEEGRTGREWRLSEQDARAGWKGHYTVMNKEKDGDRMARCYEELTENWRGSNGVVRGLNLWRYDRGWWRDSEDFLFGGNDGER
jgi:hypothetical protein